MKVIFLVLLVFQASFLIAQKKYNCILISKNIHEYDSKKFIGRLKLISDSALVLTLHKKDTSFNWADLKLVKFRKNNGFMRTIFPIPVIAGTLYTIIVPFGIISIPVALSYTCIFGMPVYLIIRNHKFEINNYQDYKLLQSASGKYISK